jgi:hypothetical protein
MAAVWLLFGVGVRVDVAEEDDVVVDGFGTVATPVEKEAEERVDVKVA